MGTRLCFWFVVFLEVGEHGNIDRKHLFPQQCFAAFAGLEIPTEKKIMNKVNFENYVVLQISFIDLI